jgi:hypothetical protein
MIANDRRISWLPFENEKPTTPTFWDFPGGREDFHIRSAA